MNIAHREYLALLFTAVGLKWLGTWLIMKWMPLRLALTPKHIKLARVRARAVSHVQGRHRGQDCRAAPACCFIFR